MICQLRRTHDADALVMRVMQIKQSAMVVPSVPFVSNEEYAALINTRVRAGVRVPSMNDGILQRVYHRLLHRMKSKLPSNVSAIVYEQEKYPSAKQHLSQQLNILGSTRTRKSILEDYMTASLFFTRLLTGSVWRIRILLPSLWP